MGELVGAGIELAVVTRLVHTNAPQDDRRMVPIAADHFADVLNRKVLPRLVANVLPAGDLFENEQAEFVTGIKKMRRLRIMRRADHVAMQLFP